MFIWYFKETLIMAKILTFTAVIHKEDDMYVANCPEIGTVSQGHTIDEAIANLKEATELYLEEFPIEKGENPIMTVFEVSVDAPKRPIGH